jgi:hypothetical protein
MTNKTTPKRPINGGEKDTGISPEVNVASSSENLKGPMSEAGKLLKHTGDIKAAKNPKDTGRTYRFSRDAAYVQ